MKATINLELNDFAVPVPNFVRIKQVVGRREDGWNPSEGSPLSELDGETLTKLCNNFVAAVFQKAGKRLPPIAV